MKKRLIFFYYCKRRIGGGQRNTKEGNTKEDGDVSNANEWLRREWKVTTEYPRAAWTAAESHSLHNSFKNVFMVSREKINDGKKNHVYMPGKRSWRHCSFRFLESWKWWSQTGEISSNIYFKSKDIYSDYVSPLDKLLLHFIFIYVMYYPWCFCCRCGVYRVTLFQSKQVSEDHFVELLLSFYLRICGFRG